MEKRDKPYLAIMRILQIGNDQIRRYGKARVSTEHKLKNGFIRKDHHVLHFSDRDMAAFLAPFGLRDLGIGKMNRRLIQTASNFQPELILLGHCDLIKNQTLGEIRHSVPNVRIAYRNVDPLFVPHNVTAIHQRTEHVDAIFITTAGQGLDQFRGKRASIHYIPNPTDASIEKLNNSTRDDLPYDLFFCGNSDEHTSRTETINYLKSALANDEICFKAFGYFGESNIWGHDYERVLEQSKMGLNLNRQEDFLYSSARLAQLMGNGILAITHKSAELHRLFGDGTLVYFEENEELPDLVRSLKKDDRQRRAIAARGRDFYRNHFNSDSIAQYIVERTCGLPFSENYIWADY